MVYLLFLTALFLSAIAAWYSIAGLMAIFAAAALPIMIMGGALEVSKLVVASWLYRSWKVVPFLMKTYFTVALVVLMGLTSMGIFGYLSKAHLDQAVPSGDVQAKLNLIDEKIKTEKENINAYRANLAQLDAQINKYTELGNVSKGVAVRKQQSSERGTLIRDIETSQTKIAKLNEERQPIASEVRKVEAEVGPIKYIAELIYGEEAKNEGFLEKAVRIVILLIVFVFDPLAVLMLIAANSMIRREEKEDIKTVEEPPVKKSIDDFVPQPKELVVETPKVSEPETDSNNAFKELEEEIPVSDNAEVKVEKQKDWEPELYARVGVKTSEKEVGRYLEELQPKSKAESFIMKVGEIEKAVDDLQK